MDDRRFDDLARSLAGPQPRRRFLRGLLVALGAGGVATAGLMHDEEGASSAPCRPAGQPCLGPRDCCAGLACQAPGPGAPKRCRVVPTATATSTPTNTPTPTPCAGVQLSNGTCANSCGAGCEASPCSCGSCFCERNFCGLFSSGAPNCSTDNDCPSGLFCSNSSCINVC